MMATITEQFKINLPLLNPFMMNEKNPKVKTEYFS